MCRCWHRAQWELHYAWQTNDIARGWWACGVYCLILGTRLDVPDGIFLLAILVWLLVLVALYWAATGRWCPCRRLRTGRVPIWDRYEERIVRWEDGSRCVCFRCGEHPVI